jgi:hypothetical protein
MMLIALMMLVLILMIVMTVLVLVTAAVPMLMRVYHLPMIAATSVLVGTIGLNSIPLSMPVMRVRAPLVSAGDVVTMQHPHDVQVAQQSEDRSPQHHQRVFDDGEAKDAVGGLQEELQGDYPDNGHVDKRSQRLHLLVPEGQVLGTLLVALVDGVEGDDVCGDVGEEVEGVGEDGDGVRVVSAQELDRHEEQRNEGDLPQLRNHHSVLFVHYNNNNSPLSNGTLRISFPFIHNSLFLELRKTIDLLENNSPRAQHQTKDGNVGGIGDGPQQDALPEVALIFSLVSTIESPGILL